MNRRGSYSIEFGLMFPFVLIMMIAAAELWWFMYIMSYEQHHINQYCGEDYYEDAAALDCRTTCWGDLSEDDDYYYCYYEHEWEQISGLVPEEWVPDKISIESVRRKEYENENEDRDTSSW
jgi:hypothetical protein